MKSNCIGTSTAVIDRTLVPDFAMNEDFRPDDFVAWLGILKQGLKVGGLQRALTIYRKRAGSQSSNKILIAKRVLNIYRNQQSLGFLEVIWYFGNYAVRGFLKHYVSVPLNRRRIDENWKNDS